MKTELVRSFLMSFGLWIIDVSVYWMDDTDEAIGVKDYLLWCLVCIGEDIFNSGYYGSKAELEDIDLDAVPLEYMTDRQIYHYLHKSEEEEK